MATSIHDILSEFRVVSFDERDKGDRFERLMQAYLTTEPQYAQLYSDVWMWSDYPQRGNRRDTGIDLVARARDTGELTAIQCKFFDPSTTVTKPMLDSFLAASSKNLDGKPEFSARLVISTSDNWGRNAEDAVENQNPPVQRLRVQDLDESSIDWEQFSFARPGELTKKAAKEPFPHQLLAISKVIEGFQSADRGKLIMACGTGKTFTSLKLVEEVVPRGGTVLFLVPSISLLSQTLKEWTIESALPLRSFAVCSDVSVGKRKSDEDIPVTDLAYPATTNTTKLVQKFAEIPDGFDGITVVFSTYQSIDVVAQAQGKGIPEFDLIICDEAHRTTGVTLAGDEESAFVKVHNQDYIKAKKRLYMTATPRIYADASKSKAAEAGAVLTDMNNPAFYGEEFHRLGFGEAVTMGRLTDYKVLVLAVDESYISKRFQRLLADENNELTLDDAAKIVGCWNGLSKRSLTPEEFSLDPEPMKRAVAFARNINESKKIANLFEKVVEAEIEALDEDADSLLDVEVRHVDGTYNVLDRNKELDWLKQDPGAGNARILTNARVLSEGVDVPALDAVMFLNPRDSVVDVVQSVGRVMRKLEGKKYGYVILPIGVPADMDPATALNDNKKYKVVWQVLQALRAHDERFDAMVNKIDLTKSTEGKLSVIGVGGGGSEDGKDKAGDTSVTLDFPALDQWRDAILAKIVQKVGERRYWENWAKDVAGIAADHITRIKALVEGSDAALHDEFARFLKGLQDNLNPFITERDAIEMLSQHLITKPVFDALFEGYAFSDHNPVSQVMQRMIDALEEQHLEKETEKLDKFYESVRTRAAGITDAAAKQQIVKELYEKFFQTAFSGTSDRLGIVYTPNEIVDFIIHSVNDALKTEFGVSVSDEGVHVLDPFTGTGTFIVRLLQSGLIKGEDLARKYRYELHANEIVLLAYYVAAINVEETFHELTRDDYEPFTGIVLTDTFQMNEADDELDGQGVFPENNERVEAQKALDIRVIIGNPPYSVGQGSENDNNKNLKYPSLDARIEQTYASRSNAVLKRNLYDSYVRALRWASDRLGDSGVLAFVLNGGFIDANSGDGLRKSLTDEFTKVYVYNLRGNALGSGERRKKEAGNVFGSGSRASVAILILVKHGTDSTDNVSYFQVADFMTAREKLEQLEEQRSHMGVPWTQISPNTAGDWINHRDESFGGYVPLGAKQGDAAVTFFRTYTLGVTTNRDAWTVGFSSREVLASVARSMEWFNGELRAGVPLEDVDMNPRVFSWTRATRSRYIAGRPLSFDGTCLVPSMYRPFTRAHLYFDRSYNEMVYRMPSVYPGPGMPNFGIAVSGTGSLGDFSALMTDSVISLDLLSKTQYFPRYTYQERSSEGDLLSGLDDDKSSHLRIDNITDEVLRDFQLSFGEDLTKDDLFYYVYGVLHSPQYRERYAADLKKMLPRIPKVREFRTFSDAGRTLSELHLGYESVKPFDLDVRMGTGSDLRVEKMRYAKRGQEVDRSTVIYNSNILVSGIPDEAHEYRLGSRSAIDWIIERYQVKMDKASGIVNDPNDWADEQGNPRYILDLLARIVTVSVETVKIVKSLPPLEVIE
ncbi:MAG: DEAD/DEAH box helicase [Microcella sp.]